MRRREGRREGGREGEDVPCDISNHVIKRCLKGTTIPGLRPNHFALKLKERKREREGENLLSYLPGDISNDRLPVVEGCLEGTAILGLDTNDLALGPQRLNG